MIVRKVHTKSLRILLFLLFLCRSSALGDDDDDDDDNDGGEPLKKMSLKDYRALVAPNDDYFYANNYRTDCDLFHCKTGAGFHRREKGEIPTEPSSGRFCLDDMSSCAFKDAEDAGSKYDSGLTNLQNMDKNFGNGGVFATWSRLVAAKEDLTCWSHGASLSDVSR